MAVTLSQVHDAYLDGLGKSSQVGGVCFLRRVRVVLDGGTTVAPITSAFLGVSKIVRCESIVALSAAAAPFVSVESESSFSITSAANASYDVFLLVAGM